jgi:hypothetical protein
VSTRLITMGAAMVLAMSQIEAIKMKKIICGP